MIKKNDPLDVPAEVALAICAEKASQHDAGWMEVFREDGAFRLTPSHRRGESESDSERAAASWRFHPRGLPYIEALMEAMRPDKQFANMGPHRPAELQRALDQATHDSHKNYQMVHPPVAFRRVFTAIVKEFLASAIREMPVPGADGEAGQTSETRETLKVNAALLLGLSLAMGDMDSCENLLSCCPEAHSIPMRFSFTKGPAKGREWVTPAYLAAKFHQSRGLELLARHGWNPASPVLFTKTFALDDCGYVADEPCDEVSKNELPTQENAGEFAVKTLCTHLEHEMVNGRAGEIIDSVLGTLARLVKIEGEVKGLDPAAYWEGPAGDEVRAFACNYLERNNISACPPFIDALDAEGCFDQGLERVVLDAAIAADRATLARFRDRIDWTAYGGDSFLPVVVADSLSWREKVYHAGIRELASDLCRWSILAGQGQRLADPGPTSHADVINQGYTALPPIASPLHLFSQYGLADCAGMALEQGADMDALPTNDNLNHADKSAKDVALEGGHEGVLTVMRSFKAKKEALAALSEFRSASPG